MNKYYRQLRLLGLNAVRAFIAAKMLSRSAVAFDANVIEAVAFGMRTWSDHMCRVFVSHGYRWPLRDDAK